MVKATLAKEVNNTIEYIYPKTSADLVEYSSSQTVEQKIQSIDSTISTIDARITNLSSTTVSGNVATDATLEVTDIRLGADGTVYNSAGESVRSQITQLSNDIQLNDQKVKDVNGILNNYKIYYKKDIVINEFYPGYISGLNNIMPQNNTNKEVYTDYIDIKNINVLGILINIRMEYDDNFWTRICYYDENKTFITELSYTYSQYINNIDKNNIYNIYNYDDYNYIRISFRTFGSSSSLTIYYSNAKYDNIIKYIDSIDRKINSNVLYNKLNLSDIFVIGNLQIFDNKVTYKNYIIIRICTKEPIYLKENTIIQYDSNLRMHLSRVNSNKIKNITEVYDTGWVEWSNKDSYAYTPYPGIVKINTSGYYCIIIARNVLEENLRNNTPVIYSIYELLNNFKICDNPIIIINNKLYDGQLIDGYIGTSNKIYQQASNINYEKLFIFNINNNVKINFKSNNHLNSNIELENKGWYSYTIVDKFYNQLMYSANYITPQNYQDYNIQEDIIIDISNINNAMYCIFSFRTNNEDYLITINEEDSLAIEDIDTRIENYLTTQNEGAITDTYLGFINSSGYIYEQNETNKEYYTNFIKVKNNTDYIVTLDYGNNIYSMWLALALYDEYKNFIYRQVIVDNVNQKYYSNSLNKYLANQNIKYFRITYRSFDINNCLNLLSKFIIYQSANLNGVELLYPSKTIKQIAHRGDDVDAPQCTAPSYIIARKLGFEINENDVFNSSDGVLICWHDPTLGRINVNSHIVTIEGYDVYIDGNNNCYYYDNDNNELYEYNNNDNEYMPSLENIENLTLMNGGNYSVTDILFKDLKRFDFGLYKALQFKGTQILTFEEWVLLSKELGMEIYIDRKNEWTAENMTYMYNILKKYGMRDKTTWINITKTNADILKNLYPKFRFGTLSAPSQAGMETWSDYKQDTSGRGGFFFNPNGDELTYEQAQLAIDNGFEIEAWYVDKTSRTDDVNFAKIRELISFGVTGLTLDKYRISDAYADLYNKYIF